LGKKLAFVLKWSYSIHKHDWHCQGAEGCDMEVGMMLGTGRQRYG